MSNIAGKAYAMNVITPINRWLVYLNRLKFKLAYLYPFSKKLRGLVTLSLIHYARWVIVMPNQFPRLSDEQPRETLRYAYMLFFSNFNGSWAQYVDSFHMAIPDGLDRIWRFNKRYPKSVPLAPFHRYILHNQIWTEHYYNAYPLAASNDVKAAMALQPALLELAEASQTCDAEAFARKFRAMLFENQAHLGTMAPSPVVSLAAEATAEAQRRAGDQHG